MKKTITISLVAVLAAAIFRLLRPAAAMARAISKLELSADLDRYCYSEQIDGEVLKAVKPFGDCILEQLSRGASPPFFVTDKDHSEFVRANKEEFLIGLRTYLHFFRDDVTVKVHDQEGQELPCMYVTEYNPR